MRKMLLNLFFHQEYLKYRKEHDDLIGLMKNYAGLLIDTADLRDDIRLVLHGQSPKTFKE